MYFGKFTTHSLGTQVEKKAILRMWHCVSEIRNLHLVLEGNRTMEPRGTCCEYMKNVIVN